MEEAYDLHQYTHVVALYIRKTEVSFKYFSTIIRTIYYKNNSTDKKSCITYDKHKTRIKGWGDNHFESKREDDVYIDNFRDELYQVFKKDKDEWNEDDLFLLKAVSDFIQLSTKEIIKKSKGEIKGTDELHYIFVVPSDWKEEIREALLRPIFVQSNLISANDHNDRLLFCSDLETILYQLTNRTMNRNIFDFKKRKTILCILNPKSESEVLIKSNLVSTINSLFDFPSSLLYPKVERYNSLSLTINTFKEGIRACIKDKLPLAIQEEIIRVIMRTSLSCKAIKNEDYDLMKPLIDDTSEWKLDKRQKNFIKSIRILDICSQVRENMTNNIDDLLLNDTVKVYSIYVRIDSFSSKIYPNENLLKWSEYLLTYNQTYSRNRNIKFTSNYYRQELSFNNIMNGAIVYGMNAINNADIYSRPRILSVKNPPTSSSIFRESKPDAIMNIDISIESTILSYSLLDENGFVKEIWNHNDFLTNKNVCSLGYFFSFSEATITLNVKHSFIEFAKDYLMDDGSFLSGNKNNVFLQLNAMKIETILCKDSCVEDLLVSTQQQIYIKAFLLLYMTYIKYVVSSKLSDTADPNMEIKIGYNITVEKILLNRLFNTKEGLQNIIYASGLLQKDENSKKLRIITQGERIMYLIRQSLGLPFPFMSLFVLSQLHENYIQLTLNQVVTESSPGKKDQEIIIIHDTIICIPNVYTSLCLNMWNNIVENNSLIKLCHIHQEYSRNDLIEIFSLQNQAKFIENLKEYISKGKLGNNSSQLATDKITIQLSVSCNCRVYLTVRNIIGISFLPVLQDIASLVSASFVNKELFGNFWNIQYLFQLIHFDYNVFLHDSLIKMLKETTEDIMIEQGVDVSHYVIPKSLNQLLQPVLHQQPVSYKEFQVGTLHRVYGDRYGFGVQGSSPKFKLIYKRKTIDTETVSVDKETVFPLFKKGDIVNDFPRNLTFYLSPQEELRMDEIYINYFKLEMPCDLNTDGTASFYDVQESIKAYPFNGLPVELKSGRDTPIMISIRYDTYSGSIILIPKVVGQDFDVYGQQRLGTPMHLSWF